jgi:apolipoprotein N-acyltransferase
MILRLKKHRYLMSILSGILMVLSFPYTGSLTPLVFISWIPLLTVEHTISFNRYRSSKVFIHALIAFFIYNIGATWWVYYASGIGAAMAIILNSIFMALVFQLFHIAKKNLGNREGFLSLILFWISFEYIHYHWELSWPWLHLGNVFSTQPSWVQWYSITGVHGGTLWVLLVNVLLFQYLNKLDTKRIQEKKTVVHALLPLSVIIVPIVLSLAVYYTYEEYGKEVEVVVVQPNIDPYNEKFEAPVEDQINKLWKLAESRITRNTALLVAPETALSQGFYEEDAPFTESVRLLTEHKKKKGLPAILIGASTARLYEREHSRASRPMAGGPGFVEYYNTSMLINETNDLSFLHKSLLVPGVEIIPFSDILPFLEQLSIDNGGTTGSLGTEKSPEIMKSADITLAPMICYESVCGEMLAAQCRKGAEIVCVITNDGWWKDTPGYKQHMSFSRLRAIESRRYVARSANTGISCIIDQKGDILKKTEWWEPAAIRATLKQNNEITFYSKYATLMWKPVLFVSLGLVLFSCYKWLKRRHL